MDAGGQLVRILGTWGTSGHPFQVAPPLPIHSLALSSSLHAFTSILGNYHPWTVLDGDTAVSKGQGSCPRGAHLPLWRKQEISSPASEAISESSGC